MSGDDRHSTRPRRGDLSSALLTAAACVIALTLVVRELRPSRAQTRIIGPSAVADSTWQKLLKAGHVIGRSPAPVTIAVFSDFECPFCGRFHSRWNALHKRFADTVALVFIHYPLDRHRFARPAAMAAECAEKQGRFAEYADAIFAAQDSLGILTWTDLATRAHVDTVPFKQCVTDSSSGSDFQIAKDLAAEVGVAGTPTVVIDGVKYREPPTDEQILQSIERIRSKRH